MHIAIVGAGQAGLQLAESLRRGGFAGGLTLIGDEPVAPYQRPPLSKKYLLSEVDPARLQFRAAEHYAKQHIATRLATRVTAIVRAAQELELADGSRITYDRLALTTGARVRKLPLRGAEDPRVCYLRDLTDADRLRTALARARRIVIVGGGFIGLEVAAVARQLGRRVTLVEAQSRLMPRVVAPLVSEHYASLHTAHGVRLLPGRQVAALDPAVAALGVELSDGERLTADLVVVGIGVVPNSELAEMAGLACESGILVDEFSRTSDPSIVAAGDCTRHRNVRYPLPHRLESVQNAVDQANVAAASLLGAPLAYDQVPWFWSDQYDVKLQMVGLSGGYDRSVVRGSPAAGAFSVFYYAGERLIAVDSVNRPAEHMLARRLMTEGIDVGWDAAGDPGTDLKSLLPGG